MVAAPIIVSVPATTANLGPGFDCLGAALNLQNHFQFTSLSAAPDTVDIVVQGSEAERLATDASNLVYRSFAALFRQLQQSPPAVRIDIDLRVPLARGLGSSSTAIVGGLLGANAMAGSPLDVEAIARLATELEGHPDNVIPALLGGCRLAVSHGEGGCTLCEVPWHPEVIPVVAIPEFELSTAAARQVLPQHYSRADAIFNLAHMGLLIRALETGNGDWLRQALCDRIHQPYRQSLIHGYGAVAMAARAAGAYGVVISGAGPTLLALTSAAQATSVQQAMAEGWQQQGIACQVLQLCIDAQGARYAEFPP
ncbi:Homoserine kinase [Halomicronema hongdechloris C2206]|uniref:Homoserine kinase n=1 Tax=Halomicronema hongdechloris C2206 TaxID=1641165 RepID=A0A1Z3HQ01_9CYAN|nr:homoserine kinase [Halomicronema hongdechloris]ASC72378.1 Homoserine kinase [Halomicronema hongdechloris C2206]